VPITILICVEATSSRAVNRVDSGDGVRHPYRHVSAGTPSQSRDLLHSRPKVERVSPDQPSHVGKLANVREETSLPDASAMAQEACRKYVTIAQPGTSPAMTTTLASARTRCRPGIRRVRCLANVPIFNKRGLALARIPQISFRWSSARFRGLVTRGARPLAAAPRSGIDMLSAGPAHPSSSPPLALRHKPPSTQLPQLVASKFNE